MPDPSTKPTREREPSDAGESTNALGSAALYVLPAALSTAVVQWLRGFGDLADNLLIAGGFGLLFVFLFVGLHSLASPRHEKVPWE